MTQIEALQPIFDKTVEHLANQGERSIGKWFIAGNNCLYRGPKGRKCAVGIWIPDDEYNPNFEGDSLGDLIVDLQYQPPVIREAGVHREQAITLLCRMQTAHDDTSSDVDHLKDQLRIIACDFNLNPDKVALVTRWS